MEDIIRKLIQISTLVDAGLARPEIVQPQQLIGQLANSSLTFEEKSNILLDLVRKKVLTEAVKVEAGELLVASLSCSAPSSQPSSNNRGAMSGGNESHLVQRDRSTAMGSHMVFPVESFDSIEEFRPLQPTPSAKDLLEDLQHWLAGPALIPRITYPHYITLHPCHADSFLYLPTNTRVRVGTDSGDGTRYRPLWEVQQFLKRHKKHHRCWSILLQDLESMLRRTGNTYLWNIRFLKGERLPFQVVHGEGGGCDLDGSSGCRVRCSCSKPAPSTRLEEFWQEQDVRTSDQVS